MMVFSLGSLKMTLAFLVFILSVSVSYSQNQEESVFFINRGKNLEWISHSTNDDALHHIISKEVFRHLEIRKGKIDGLAHLHGVHAEIIEFEIKAIEKS